jgi:hypothetical protein
MWGICANLDPKMKQMHNKRLAKNVLNLNRECIRNVCKLVQVKDNNLAKCMDVVRERSLNKGKNG